MPVQVEIHESIGRIRVSKRFDFTVHREFKEAYTALLSNPEISEVEVDMSQTDYLDSTALGMLIHMKEAAGNGKEVTLLNPSTQAANILKVANFAKLFTFKID